MESLTFSENPLRCGCRIAELIFPSSALSGRSFRAPTGAALGSAELLGAYGCLNLDPDPGPSRIPFLPKRLPAGALPRRCWHVAGCLPGLVLSERVDLGFLMFELRMCKVFLEVGPLGSQAHPTGPKEACLKIRSYNNVWDGTA